ncbi:alpha/beta hydrolase family protein [Vagococcus carniphilus]|uniref:Alpha/beta hydrolase n=1 Tax=Vagococcus carniphilus TaxID=218144 RepID=A0A430B1G6_9ENTE|nr:alpha/beta hydrolase [Vagococcus carniphilus]QNN74077.1 alpha/beta hydrolase [Vagococcus carniphilus]RSU14139.1 alpha/beta hydrolase [Vagococcus carniphilus]
MKKVLISIGATLVLLVTIFLMGNHYNFKEEQLTVQTSKNELSVFLATPKQKKIKGTVFFIHGDGGQNATQDGGYKPIMETLAEKGYASVSWDKPGVGGSSGNWLKQSMEERADEASEVIDWMKKNKPELMNKVGLWGASQAGWVIPKIDNNRQDISFSMLVAPGVNWRTQSEYFTVNQAKKEGKSNDEIKKIVKDFRKDSDLIVKNKNYQTYQKASGTSEMTDDRFEFVKKNMELDSSDDLRKMKGHVYLILGEKDENVDSIATKKAYEENISSNLLQVKTIKNAEHRMINPTIANSEALTTLTAIMIPKYYLVSPEYLDYSANILNAE